MINGWLSLPVKNPELGKWYEKLDCEILARRSDGSVVVGSEDHGRIIVCLRGQTLNHPDQLQIHFAVPDVDTEFAHLTRAGVEFREPPKDMPWRWRHATTSDSGGTYD